MADLLVRNATLPDGRPGCDVLVTDGRIVEVAPRISAAAVPVLDVEGYLLSPPFVDAHFHLDSALSYGLPRVNRSGTLLEGIAVWGELKPMLTQDDTDDFFRQFGTPGKESELGVRTLGSGIEIHRPDVYRRLDTAAVAGSRGEWKRASLSNS